MCDIYRCPSDQVVIIHPSKTLVTVGTGEGCSSGHSGRHFKVWVVGRWHGHERYPMAVTHKCKGMFEALTVHFGLKESDM